MSSAASRPILEGVPAPSPSVPSGSSSGSGPVATVPKYRPLCVLGHGGMGSVEAVAEELDDGTTRVVALKRILRVPGADASRLEMFLREARLTTLLSHPNVIQSLAYGESKGEVFLAMEYVAGEPLSRIISRARERSELLEPSVVAHILAEACAGLHAAHELKGEDGESLGVVHRDVSPHNVMVGYDGAVKILDFGVAKIELAESAVRTKTGEVKGKTAYMSPEQAMGEEVDRRSDLYSIGAVLFECVTGRRMWGTGTDFDVLRRLALEDPPKLAIEAPSAASELATLQSELVLRDRNARPATAQVVEERLRAFAAATTQADVRATMDRLFEGERARREAAITEAMRVSATEEPPSGLPKSPSFETGESGPVFVTHRATPVPTPPRRRGAGVAIPATVALVLCGVAGVAFALRVVPRGGPPSTDVRELATRVQEVPSATPAIATTATAQVPTAPPAPLVPSTVMVPLTRGVSVAPRRIAVPHVSARLPLATSPAPSSSAAVVSKPKTPEPPEVDPAPF